MNKSPEGNLVVLCPRAKCFVSSLSAVDMSGGVKWYSTAHAQGRHEGHNWVLDEVLVAQAILISIVLAMRAIARTDWGKRLKTILLADSTENWCGWKEAEEQEQTSSRRTQGMAPFRKQLSTTHTIIDAKSRRRVTTPGVFRKIVRDADQKKGRRRFAKFYLVPKEYVRDERGEVVKTMGRMILACHRVNKEFEKPPRVHLPTMEALFGMMEEFEDMYCTSLDFRHFFDQIPLPGTVTTDSPASFFSVEDENGEIYELQVLPMGFSWSPWIAQNIAMGMLYETRERFADKHGCAADSERVGRRPSASPDSTRER